MEGKFRKPTELEMAVIGRLLRAEFSGQNELVTQVEHIAVKDRDKNGSVDISVDESQPRAAVRNRVPVEATFTDVDGINVNILLHVIDGRLNALEIYRDDSGPLRSVVVPEKFTVYADHG